MDWNSRGRGRRPRWLTGVLPATVLTAATVLSGPVEANGGLRYRYVAGWEGVAPGPEAEGPLSRATGDQWELEEIEFEPVGQSFDVAIDDDVMESPMLVPVSVHMTDVRAKTVSRRLCLSDNTKQRVSIPAGTVKVTVDVLNSDANAFGCRVGSSGTTGIATVWP